MTESVMASRPESSESTRLLSPHSFQHHLYNTSEDQSSEEEEFKEEIAEIITTRRLRHLKRPNGHPITTVDHGTYLGIHIPEPDKLPPLDNPVTVSLHTCKQKVFLPYLRLLRMLGWRPLIPEDTGPSCWKKAVNVSYLLLIIALIILAYILQYAACFRRDRAVSRTVVTMLPIIPLNSTVTAEPPDLVECQHNVISQYIIPDLLHCAAYIYSFILLRISQNEELVVLMETVFLSSSATHSGYLSQTRLIRNLRWLLFLGIGWLGFCFLTMILDIASDSKDFSFTWMDPPAGSHQLRYLLMGLMLLGFVAMDIVYLAVVLSYSVQCSLLIFYIRGLQEKVREKSIDLQQAIKEISESEKYLKVLNSNTSSAVSLVCFNFATMVVMGFIGFMEGKAENFTNFMFITTALDIASWLIALSAPLIQAGRLSEACNSMKKLGHEIRVRPFGYQDASQLDLDSFLLFTSGLNMRAKIFRIPVRSFHLMTVVVVVCFIILLLFQTGQLKIWL